MGYGHLMVTDTQFFVLGVASNSLHMYMITFLSNAVNWANNIIYSGSGSWSWSASYSESILSSDYSLIYSYFTFGSDRYLYFAGMSVLDGSVATTRYKSNTIVSNLWGAALNGDYIIATTEAPVSLVIFRIPTSTFIIMSFSFKLYEWGVERSSGR